MIAWIGNIFICIGLWRLGSKCRDAFFFSIVGEVIWIYWSASERLWSLTFICCVFCIMAIRGAILWNKKEPDQCLTPNS